jgi:maltose phosphorylase
VVACKIRNLSKAYELYLRTSRLDLDDYNKEAREGLHITSMSGSWLAIVKGFAGMRVKNDILFFDPQMPTQWQSYSFMIKFRDYVIQVKVSTAQTSIHNLSGKDLTIKFRDEFVKILPGQMVNQIN